MKVDRLAVVPRNHGFRQRVAGPIHERSKCAGLGRLLPRSGSAAKSYAPEVHMTLRYCA